MRSLLLISALLFITPSIARGQHSGLWTRSNALLKLARHDVSVSIHHPVAETTVTQEFDNPGATDLEAFFYYPVPAGATVTGMALWVNGVRREARMLERQQAREIYQGIVDEKRDPALLERLDGNIFRIRIFPVLARSRQRVELRFVQPVDQDGPGRYRYTLRRPPGKPIFNIGLGVRLQTMSRPLKQIHLTGYRGRFSFMEGTYTLPMAHAKQSFREDIHLRYQLHVPLEEAAVVTLDHEGKRLFVAELPLKGAQRLTQKAALLIDSSRSMAPHLAQVQGLAVKILERGPADAQVAVMPFDILPGATVNFATAGEQNLERINALESRGGTAYIPAFQAALTAGARHIICITDGGTRFHQEELEHLLRIIHDHPHIMVSIIATAGALNEDVLIDLATISGGMFQKLNAESDGDALARGLMNRPSKSGGALQGAGVGEGEVREIRREAHRVLVTGAIPLTDAAPAKERTLTMAQGTYPLDLRTRSQISCSIEGSEAPLWQGVRRAHTRRYVTDEHPLGELFQFAGIIKRGQRTEGPSSRSHSGWIVALNDHVICERVLRSQAPSVRGVSGLWAAAKIQHQMRLIRVRGETEAARSAVVKLSMQYNVLSEYTALLATETDADYKRATSGRKWQRRPAQRLGDELPQTNFHSTPEPHEIALCALALLMLMVARRRGRLFS